LPDKLPQRLALIKPSALGDVVHTLPVLTALRLLYPHAHITWVVHTAYAPLLEGHPHLDAVLPFDRGIFRHKSLRTVLRYLADWWAQLRQQRFDWVIDLQGLLRSGLMTWASAAPVRLGLHSAREGSRLAYTHRLFIPHEHRLHAVDRYWQLIVTLGGADLPLRFVLPVDPQQRQLARQLWSALPRPWIALAPGARWSTKRWPPSAFAQLLHRLQQHTPAGCLILGAAEDTPLAQQIATHLNGPVRSLTGQTSLPLLVALLAECDLFIGNDSGPLHLAAALGKPCLAPFTCTLPTRHGPYTFPQGAVPVALPCAGSYRKECPHLLCHHTLTVDQLWTRLWDLGLFPRLCHSPAA
jgi:lipopolysaccharide heptosyltransferase I